MGTSRRVEEAVNDEEGDGSSKHLTDFEINMNEVKPLSSHGSSDSSEDLSTFLGNKGTDNDENKIIDKSQQSELKSPTHYRVSFVSSKEQSTENHQMGSGGQVHGGYLPNRIPSSVFSGKPATPMDWSTASNESLFSIQVGNGSFSKDQYFMLYKSGELTKLDEQIIAQGNVLPSLKELEDMENTGKGSRATGMSKNPTMAVETSDVAEDHSNRMIPPAAVVHRPINNIPTVDHGEVAGYHSQERKVPSKVHNLPTSSNSGLSDESSNTSTLSFSFPVLAGTDGGRFSSVNGDYQNNKGFQAQSVKQQRHEEQQQQEQPQSPEELQPQSPAVTPKIAASRSWFSRFYCCRCS